ncbi:flavoprotein [Streptomyces sp. CB03238]|uniref:flavoprotein n=1 Tax=Streptomyces sp. CB03238 TaxID=1907777 RepID=UPI000A10889F|nr:flavoprotein [Streptomyces sp. CB03238]ORT60467.1 flavoprotein [Streptomyces sp. CB03238]
MTRTLYLFCSAAPPVFDVARAIENAQSRGWDVCLGLTPTAARWLGHSLDGLAALTGHPVRFEYDLPGRPDVWPEADVVLFAPATFGSLNEWALGLTAKFVVSVAVQGVGKGIPTMMMPCVNEAHVRHPAFGTSVATLRAAGVTVLYGEGAYMANPPGQELPGGYPWAVALNALEGAYGLRPTPP